MNKQSTLNYSVRKARTSSGKLQDDIPACRVLRSRNLESTGERDVVAMTTRRRKRVKSSEMVNDAHQVTDENCGNVSVLQLRTADHPDGDTSSNMAITKQLFSPKRRPLEASPPPMIMSPRKTSSTPVKQSPRKVLFSPKKSVLYSPRKVGFSPRKSLGSPRKVLDSPRKVLHSPHKVLNSPRKVLNSPHKILGSPCKPSSPVRPSASSETSPAPKTPTKSPHRRPKGVPNPTFSTPSRKELLLAKLSKSKGSSSPSLRAAKRQLQLGCATSRLLGRTAEQAEIQQHLVDHLERRQPCSIYVSGAPGTGKTATLTEVLRKLEETYAFKTVDINCMACSTAKKVYASIATQLNLGVATKKSVQTYITKKTTARMIVMMLDEIDQLDSATHGFLYTLFEWPALPGSRLILIGVANALDLTDRTLPRLKANISYQLKLINFLPYTKDEIVEILKDRLQEIPDIDTVMGPAALQFCARKVSAITGDIRKALNICRRAIEMVERKSDTAKVTLPFVSKVIQEVYGGNVANQLAPTSNTSTPNASLPLQQQLLLCSVAIATSDKQGAKSGDVQAGRLHTVFSRICTSKSLFVPDFSECANMCSLLEARGLIAIKKSKHIRTQKITLRLQHCELEKVLEDKTLLSDVLRNASKYIT